MFLEVRESSGNHQGDLQNSVANTNLLKKSAHFDYELPQNVSAVVGKTAFLTCVVKNLKPTQKVYKPTTQLLLLKK